MQKPIMLGFALAALLAAGAWSGTARAECGPGPIVTSNSKGIVQQTVAFTTNVILLPTQTLAITFGTSGCSNSGIVKTQYEQEIYVAHTFDGLTQDMAQGDGEYLRSFAVLMGCDGTLYPAFAEWSQAHLEALSVVPETTRAWVGDLKRGLAADPRLSACTRLG